MVKKKREPLKLEYRPITDSDKAFLVSVYTDSRREEMATTQWPQEQIDTFLAMQFDLQHTQYMQNYRHATFEIILFKGEPVGRLYVDRQRDDIRIIDIALLTAYRRRGIGSRIMSDLVQEADAKGVSVSLHVEQYNPAMILYKKLGFQRLELRGVYFFMVRPAR